MLCVSPNQSKSGTGIVTTGRRHLLSIFHMLMVVVVLKHIRALYQIKET
ncbi:hypothetical protein NTE_00697 [Candidatus Nitrososphaera evergladensis SR1]|uniref:Uncharacterized protein n=1 Tax=Candidatus Nitrososphaera evergladensis SR1 TaxID=1459636 RepID=A0A075MPM4_9ARCH|nr:hypothetical protein NTE_00697 [Candidatus Nitrososphaera evergladensis SR1]